MIGANMVSWCCRGRTHWRQSELPSALRPSSSVGCWPSACDGSSAAVRRPGPIGRHVQLPPQQGTCPSPRPFQFSLRTMFIVTAVVALICGGLFAPLQSVAFGTIGGAGRPDPDGLDHRHRLRPRLSANLLCWRPLSCRHGPAPSVEGRRAVLAAFSPLSSTDPLDQEGRVVVAIYVALYLAFILLCGLVAVGVRWMIESPRRTPHPHHVHWAGPKPPASRPAAMDNSLRPCLNRRKRRQRIRASRLCFSITSHADGPTVMLKHNLRLCDDCPGRFHVKPPDAVSGRSRLPSGTSTEGSRSASGTYFSAEHESATIGPCPTPRSSPPARLKRRPSWQSLGPPEN